MPIVLLVPGTYTASARVGGESSDRHLRDRGTGEARDILLGN